MSLQLSSTIDSLAGTEQATALRHDLRDRSMTVAQLSKALRTAGIDIRELDRSAENTARLAVMASLVETLVPSVPATRKKRAVATLPKWRLMQVLRYVETNIGEPIKLANLAASHGDY